MAGGEPPRKSSSPIRAAEYFLPLHKLRQANRNWTRMLSVVAEKIEFFCTGAKLLHVYSVSQFPRQPLTPFESRFDFPDQLNLPKLMQRPKMFRRTNLRRQFPRLLTSSHAPAGAQCFSVFSATADPFRVPFRFS
jgi:hypothetical protein